MATGAAGESSNASALASVSLGSTSADVAIPSSTVSGATTTAAPSGRGGIAER